MEQKREADENARRGGVNMPNIYYATQILNLSGGFSH
jgi:hypothetical protein